MDGFSFRQFLRTEMLNVDYWGISWSTGAQHKRTTLWRMITIPIFYLEPVMIFGTCICLHLCLLAPQLESLAELSIILAVSTTINLFFDVSLVYHLIRSRSIIRLFTLFHIFYILQQSFGSLALEIRKSPKTPFRFIGLSILTALHAAVIYLQVVVINVAINSDDSSFIAILSSRHVLELKGTVLKRYSPSSILQITCSDIIERLNLSATVLLILVQQAISHAGIALDETIRLLVAMAVISILTDWIKHAFIVKSSDMSPELYSQMLYVFAVDYLKTITKNNSTHLIHRFGLNTLAYNSLLVSFVVQAISRSGLFSTASIPVCIILALLFTLCLLLFKILLRVTLAGYSAKLTSENPPLSYNDLFLTFRFEGKDSQVPNY